MYISCLPTRLQSKRSMRPAQVSSSSKLITPAVAAAGVGQLAHAALAGEVDPGLVFAAVHLVATHDGLAGADGRAGVDEADQPGLVLLGELLGAAVFEVVGHLLVGLSLGGQHRLAVGGELVLGGLPLPGGAAPTQAVVADGLGTALGDGEGDAAVGAFNHVVVEPGPGGVLEGVVVHPLRSGGRAVAGVHIDPEAVGVLLEHGPGAVAEPGGVLLGVLGVDREHGLLVFEGVAPAAAGFVAGDGLGVAPGPGRDAAVGIAGFLAPE